MNEKQDRADRHHRGHLYPFEATVARGGRARSEREHRYRQPVDMIRSGRRTTELRARSDRPAGLSGAARRSARRPRRQRRIARRRLRRPSSRARLLRYRYRRMVRGRGRRDRATPPGDRRPTLAPQTLRYASNPHQSAASMSAARDRPGNRHRDPAQGKAAERQTNLNDTDALRWADRDFSEPEVASSSTPARCGVRHGVVARGAPMRARSNPSR